jgi:hypothetical protein
MLNAKRHSLLPFNDCLLAFDFTQESSTCALRSQELGIPPATSSDSITPYGPPRPWLLVEGLGPDQALLRHENWCGVLQEVALEPSGDAEAEESDAATRLGKAQPAGGKERAVSPAAFMAAATEFVNSKCWGNLAVSLWIHPSIQAKVSGACKCPVRSALSQSSPKCHALCSESFQVVAGHFFTHQASCVQRFARASRIGLIDNHVLQAAYCSLCPQSGCK